jgi:hypothetical protein
MPGLTTAKVTDALTYCFAVSLAAGCIAFAGYKVIKLRGMENPPADMGLNFPPSKRKIITDDAVLVDPLTTGTTGRESASRDEPGRVLQPYTAEAPIREYRLLTVIDGVAFVEVLTLRGKEIMPMSVGARLPGAGRVERIGMDDGRWSLVAGDVKLKAERR